MAWLTFTQCTANTKRQLKSNPVRFTGSCRRVLLVLEWAALHKAELLDDWQLARQGQPLKTIAPLE